MGTRYARPRSGVMAKDSETKAEPENLARIARLEHAARLLDSQFRVPLIGYRVGLDGLIGLIPGVGDVAGGAASAWMIAEAARGGARKRVLARMGLNALIDSTLGAIPILGDLFDFAFKANRRNARLAVRELQRRSVTTHQRKSMEVAHYG